MLWVMPAPATAVAPWEGKMQNEMETVTAAAPPKGRWRSWAGRLTGSVRTHPAQTKRLPRACRLPAGCEPG